MGFISQIQAAFSKQSFAHLGVERQTNVQTNIYTYIHTYKHTHSSENNFSKPHGLKLPRVHCSNIHMKQLRTKQIYETLMLQEPKELPKQ